MCTLGWELLVLTNVGGYVCATTAYGNVSSMVLVGYAWKRAFPYCLSCQRLPWVDERRSIIPVDYSLIAQHVAVKVTARPLCFVGKFAV